MYNYNTDIKRVKQYILAGKCIFTLYFPKMDKRYTYKIVKDKISKNKYYKVYTLIGDNNEDNTLYRFLGLFYKNSMTLRVSSIWSNKPAEMFDYFLGILSNKYEWLETCEFYPSRHCARCGRLLTTPKSIANGVGPDCLKALED